MPEASSPARPRSANGSAPAASIRRSTHAERRGEFGLGEPVSVGVRFGAYGVGERVFVFWVGVVLVDQPTAADSVEEVFQEVVRGAFGVERGGAELVEE